MEVVVPSLVVESLNRGCLVEAVECLRTKEPGVVIFDSDYTIREPGRGALGEIPSETMDMLRTLKALGWEFLCVSNQPRRGHQVARVGARKKGHYFFPDSLEDEFGADRVLGGGANFLISHFKKTKEAVVMVSEKIREVLGSDRRSVWMVGDRDTDKQFFCRVSEVFVGEGVRFGFIKLPDSLMIRVAKNSPRLVRGAVVGFVEKVMP